MENREEPEGGTPPHGRPGPHPEDGFTDESPAPQPLKLATPYPQKPEQVRQSRASFKPSCAFAYPRSALAPIPSLLGRNRIFQQWSSPHALALQQSQYLLGGPPHYSHFVLVQRPLPLALLLSSTAMPSRYQSRGIGETSGCLEKAPHLFLAVFAVQEDMASISKRKAGNALGKQRSILDFFRTPPLDSGAKRRKVCQDSMMLLFVVQD